MLIPSGLSSRLLFAAKIPRLYTYSSIYLGVCVCVRYPVGVAYAYSYTRKSVEARPTKCYTAVHLRISIRRYIIYLPTYAESIIL